jgi:twitching motility two-component system response regulator PilG
MSPQLEIVDKPHMPESSPAFSSEGRERRKWSRARVSVSARICGGVGTLQSFEEIVTCLDISRDGIRVPTSRAGYIADQVLEVTCPFWDNPTAINLPRAAKVIRCTMTPNHTYEVVLQFLSDKPEESLLLRHAAAAFASQVRVLVVESDVRVGRAVQELLEKDGYQVVTVEKPREGLEIIQTETPHVIVAASEAEGSDISGHDLCAVVKGTPRLQHIPVILLTKSAKPSDYAASHLVGAVVCLAKPYNVERVRQAVRLVACPPSQASGYSSGFDIAAFVRAFKPSSAKKGLAFPRGLELHDS